jgi:hypothetical protein
MRSISKNYTLKYELDFAPQYKWSECNKCFNTKTGREIKQTYSKGSIGYCIQGKFKSLKALRKNLVKIKDNKCPF